MTENNSPTPQPAHGSSWLDSTAAKLTAAAVATVATLVTARDAISRAFFKSMNKGDEGAFVDLQNLRDEAINATSARATNVAVTQAPVASPVVMKKGAAFAKLLYTRNTAIAELASAPPSTFSVTNEISNINGLYNAAYKERRGFLKIYNVFDEMKALKHHQWLEVAFATVAVASVAVGAIIAIASSRGSERKFEQLADDNRKHVQSV